MRFVYNDPRSLRSAVEHLVGQQGGQPETMPIQADVDAIKGEGYREVEGNRSGRKRRAK